MPTLAEWSSGFKIRPRGFPRSSSETGDRSAHLLIAHSSEENEASTKWLNFEDTAAAPCIAFCVVEQVQSEPVGRLSWDCPSQMFRLVQLVSHLGPRVPLVLATSMQLTACASRRFSAFANKNLGFRPKQKSNPCVYPDAQRSNHSEEKFLWIGEAARSTLARVGMGCAGYRCCDRFDAFAVLRRETRHTGSQALRQRRQGRTDAVYQ